MRRAVAPARRAHVEAECALREQLSAQADALDRLLAAMTGLADELDEGRLLERFAEEASPSSPPTAASCSSAPATAAPSSRARRTEAWRPAALEAVDAADLLRSSRQPRAAPSRSRRCPALAQRGALAVLRPRRPPFSAVERAQLRVFAAAAVRTAHNARLFTLAESSASRPRCASASAPDSRTACSRRGGRAPPPRLALHDGPQQTIAGIGLIVQAASTRSAPATPTTAALAAAALEQTHGRRLAAHALVRARAHHAARPRLHGRVRRARRSALRPHKVTIAVDASAIDALDRQAQVSLYRIAQEATTNAVKHAGGTRIDVTARTPRRAASSS